MYAIHTYMCVYVLIDLSGAERAHLHVYILYINASAHVHVYILHIHVCMQYIRICVCMYS